MLTLTTRAAVEAAVADPSLDPLLCRVLALRARQLEEPGVEPGDLAHWHVVQPGDGMEDAAAALGFAPDVNLVDGARYPDPAFEPSWEWIEDHGGLWEAAFVLSDDGFGHVLLVPDDADARLTALCRAHA